MPPNMLNLQFRSKSTLDNYLANRFKLDGNRWCREIAVKNKLELINQDIVSENQECVFKFDYEQLVRKIQMTIETNHISEDDDSTAFRN